MRDAFAADTPPANADTPAGVAASPQAPDQVPYELSAEKMMQDNLLILALIFFIFYFILIRPQQKRLKTHQALMKSLQKGNKVMTSGGIIGSIVKFEGDDVVVVEVSPDVRVRIARSAI